MRMAALYLTQTEPRTVTKGGSIPGEFDLLNAVGIQTTFSRQYDAPLPLG